jgi:hypothetical protein
MKFLITVTNGDLGGGGGIRFPGWHARAGGGRGGGVRPQVPPTLQIRTNFCRQSYTHRDVEITEPPHSGPAGCNFKLKLPF